ncbi:hypothetical protein [Mycetocola manganoxydans]|nr:hypothetical protein [Mycetocola manganoxydans]GHD50849.1 hypothetical protein GCM10008097_25280 [Mycetocola manganoxydans]
MSNLLLGDQSWHRIPNALRKYDAAPRGKLESRTTAVLHNALAYLPSLQRYVLKQFQLDPELHLLWRRGGHGEGDIAGCTTTSRRALGFVETKGEKTQISHGRSCPQQCGKTLYQFAHMAHGGLPIIVVAPSQVIRKNERAWRTVYDLPERATLLSFAAMAEAIEIALNVDGAPEYSFVDAMLDVEEITLPAA